jgi:hypothetical protein
MVQPVDRLVEGSSVDGLVILNYGDPAYKNRADETQGLMRAEEIFLRLVAYLAFAEATCVPARHILEGDAMAQATVWAAPLLDEGILLPERRVEAPSFEDLARLRGLPEIGFRRAAFLDHHAGRVRRLVWQELARTYSQLLNDDLAMGGAFRRTVVGGLTGKYAQSLDRAYSDHLQNGDGTPELFVRSIEKFAPDLRNQARRWAMARYYTTPLRYDTANTREIPASAAKLLVRGKVLDPALTPFEKAAPAEQTFSRLRASIPAQSIGSSHQQYCEALLEVRRELPEARRIFSDITHASQLKDAGESLSDMFARELARQLRVRTSKGRVFTLLSSLLAGAAGGAASLAAGADIALGLGSGLAAGVGGSVAANELQNRMGDKKDRKRRPWVLAMDRLDNKVAEERR